MSHLTPTMNRLRLAMSAGSFGSVGALAAAPAVAVVAVVWAEPSVAAANAMTASTPRNLRCYYSSSRLAPRPMHRANTTGSSDTGHW